MHSPWSAPPSTATLYTNLQPQLFTPTRLVRTREPEVQQFVSQEPQPETHVLCVPENMKFSNLSRNNPNPNPNPNTLPQPQPHVWSVPMNLKFSNLFRKNPNPKHTFGAYLRTWNSVICIARTPTPIPASYLNPNHRFGGYPRTWSSAICPAWISSPTTGLVHKRDTKVQQFVLQKPQLQLQSQHFTSTPTKCLLRTENLKFTKLSSKTY